MGGRAAGIVLLLAVGAGALLFGRPLWRRYVEPPPAQAPGPGEQEVAQVPPEGPDAGPSEAPDPTDIEYWRGKVREVASQSGEGPDAGARPDVAPGGAGPSRAESSISLRALCEQGAGAAWRRFNEGSVASAEAEARALVAQEPRCVAARLVLGQVYYQRGDFAAALAQWEEARRLEPRMDGIAQLIARARREAEVEGKLGRKDSPHFAVSFDGRDDREAARAAVEILQEARGVVGRALDYFPTDAVPVILYPGEMFRDRAGPPAWAEGLYDGKIRLASAGATKRPDRFRALLYHEYTHALVHRLAAGRRVPAWVNEGLAQYAEMLVPGARSVSPARASQAIPLTALHDSFTRLDERSADAAYRQARYAVADLIQRYRLYRMRELLERIGRGRTFEEAFEDTYLVSYETFVRNWPPAQ